MVRQALSTIQIMVSLPILSSFSSSLELSCVASAAAASTFETLMVNDFKSH